LRHFGFSGFGVRILVGGPNTAVSGIAVHCYDALTTPERLNVLERLEARSGLLGTVLR
jgi:hypothetical protein